MGNLSFNLSPELEGILEGLHSFIEQEVVERHRQAGEALSEPRLMYGDDGLFTEKVLESIREVRMAAAEAGYYTMFVPESLGGGGLGCEALYRVYEDIHHRYGPHNWLTTYVVAHWVRGPSHVLEHATEEARQRVLPHLLSGRDSMCFGMSEPDAGSDARMMRTRAVPDGDEWVLNGSKIWITNGPYADFAVIFAVTDPVAAADRNGGISAFLVPTSTPGFSAEGSIRMFNSPGGDEALLYLDDVRVGKEMVLGQLGQGFDIALSGVASGRLYNAARAVGLARWALELGLDYAKRRQTFGVPISEHQGITFPMAESAMEIHAAHLMGLNCAILIDQGRSYLKELSMAKAYSTEVAARAIDRVVQVHGAMGFTNEMGFVEAWQHVRKAGVADGTAEILRRVIAQRLLKGDLDL
ncbi:MAG TPA: acyl-CoA dehydrogenase family protein [Acidimicrobiales bacterium]|nr:acyl-CoA dehydrogenase family protein [Acidimicrobiales bacterium]